MTQTSYLRQNGDTILGSEDVKCAHDVSHRISFCDTVIAAAVRIASASSCGVIAW